MPSESKIALPWQCFAQSPGGLWLKATRDETTVALWWQARTRAANGRVQMVDANGAVLADTTVAQARWGDPWTCAGSIPLDDAFVEWAGVATFDACAHGVMRHMVGLAAAGYGDDLSEIVGWFRDLAALEWLIEGATYRIEAHPLLEGIAGTVGVLWVSDDGADYALDVRVGAGDPYRIALDTPALLRAALHATVVVS